MIIPTSTTTLSDLGTVTSGAFSGALPFLYLVCGIMLAFYVVETINFWRSDLPKRYQMLQDKEKARKKQFTK